MTVALQIREVPEDVRDLLAVEATRRGQSVQAYLLGLVEREARALGNVAAFERTRLRRVPLTLDAAAIVREGRDAGFSTDRDEQS